MDAQTMKRIGERWSARPSRPPRMRWWESRTVRRHISQKVVPGGTESGYWQVEALKATGIKAPDNRPTVESILERIVGYRDMGGRV